MPIYEFHCGKCEQDSEILVPSSRWQGTKCPHCGSAKLSKKLSTFSSSAGSSSRGDCGKAASSCSTSQKRGCCGCPGAHRH